MEKLVGPRRPRPQRRSSALVSTTSAGTLAGRRGPAIARRGSRCTRSTRPWRRTPLQGRGGQHGRTPPMRFCAHRHRSSRSSRVTRSWPPRSLSQSQSPNTVGSSGSNLSKLAHSGRARAQTDAVACDEGMRHIQTSVRSRRTFLAPVTHGRTRDRPARLKGGMHQPALPGTGRGRSGPRCRVSGLPSPLRPVPRRTGSRCPLAQPLRRAPGLHLGRPRVTMGIRTQTSHVRVLPATNGATRARIRVWSKALRSSLVVVLADLPRTTGPDARGACLRTPHGVRRLGAWLPTSAVASPSPSRAMRFRR